jgi:putative addiction module killer protein
MGIFHFSDSSRGTSRIVAGIPCKGTHLAATRLTYPAPPAVHGRTASELHAGRSIQVQTIDKLYPAGYNLSMIEIRKTELFAKWLDNLNDIKAKARVLVRIERLASGNAGDVKPVGEGVSEMRINYGPGYRVYFIQRGSELIILLAGGDKSSQPRDINSAIRLARNV